MKNFRARFMALCGLAVLAAAMLAPLAAEAGCKAIMVGCPNGGFVTCTGTQQGDRCIYNADCLNGRTCPST